MSSPSVGKEMLSTPLNGLEAEYSEITVTGKMFIAYAFAETKSMQSINENLIAGYLI